MKQVKTKTMFCEDGFHYFCIGQSLGDKYDRVTFTCSCACHKERGYLGSVEYAKRLHAEWKPREWDELLRELR